LAENVSRGKLPSLYCLRRKNKKTFFEMRLQILKDLLPFLFKTPINPSPEEQIQVPMLKFFCSRKLRLLENKLERLSQASLSSQWVRTGAYPSEATFRCSTLG
jgi:hypothetical protein